MTVSPEKIRNLAVIAHIDHGKTTLLDQLLQQAQAFAAHQKMPERVMDSHDQEKERGITIFAKHTSVYYQDYKINIIDTPGHADFSGEVERVLGMVNSVLLVVDAQEGPMPQTRFVLSKALKMGLKPIVVINKIDRPHADPDRVLNETFDLFVELGANDEQLDFAHCYASALQGFAVLHPHDEPKDMQPLFDLIIARVDAPIGQTGPFLMQVATVMYDDFAGRQACGRILRGAIHKGDQLACIRSDGSQVISRVSRIQGHLGLQKVEFESSGVGDLVSLAGFEGVMIGDTLCSLERIEQLPPIEIEAPTVEIRISINNSPIAGREGGRLTMHNLRARLEWEKKANITYRIDTSTQDYITVAGRGELHLAVLIEDMRREGFELSVSKPQVIVREIEGEKCEPLERAYVQVPQEYSGAVIEELSRRKGEMLQLSTNEHGITALEFLIPTRGLMGYRNDFLTVTRGEGILTSVFDQFAPWKGEIARRSRGVLCSMAGGKATAYALFNLQARGTLFVEPGQDIYEGMVVGESSRAGDLLVNPVKAKQLTNIRSAGRDENPILVPPRRFSLEQALDYIEDDELVEVTPSTIRMRKA